MRVSPARLIAAIGSLFAVGSACFALGSVPAYVDAVGGVADAVTFFVGSTFFTAASWLQRVQSQSPAMTGVDRAQQHHRHPVRLWAWLPHDRGWCAAVTQFPETLFFNISTFAALSHNATVQEVDRHVWRPDIFGSTLFLVASGFAILALGGRLFAISPASLGWCQRGVVGGRDGGTDRDELDSCIRVARRADGSRRPRRGPVFAGTGYRWLPRDS